MKLSLRGIMRPKKMDMGGCVGPECPGCMGPNCMSKGGEIKGVHRPVFGEPNDRDSVGESKSGNDLRMSNKNKDRFPEASKSGLENVKERHRRILGEMKSMPKPQLYAEGGEVGLEPMPDSDGDEDSEMQSVCCQELLDAWERKDKAQMLDALKALILSVR